MELDNQEAHSESTNRVSCCITPSCSSEVNSDQKAVKHGYTDAKEGKFGIVVCEFLSYDF